MSNFYLVHGNLQTDNPNRLDKIISTVAEFVSIPFLIPFAIVEFFIDFNKKRKWKKRMLAESVIIEPDLYDIASKKNA
jgi:hypothetical protein